MKENKMSNVIQTGDFSALKLDEWDRTMVEDAYKAVTLANRWDFLRRPDVPGKGGFMLSDWPQMKDIDLHMKYEGHSGASYGWTMRVIERIAKGGWDAYVAEVGVRPPTLSVLEQAATVDNFLRSIPIEEMGDVRTFANAATKDERMRKLIPDIDRQAEAITKFSEGTMSYAEMRSLCG